MRRLIFVIPTLFVAAGCGEGTLIEEQADMGALEVDGSSDDDPAGAEEFFAAYEQALTAGEGFDYVQSLRGDFSTRDREPQMELPEKGSLIKYGSWGPHARTYAAKGVPDQVKYKLRWKQDRVIEAARHFIGTPYEHRHVPAAGGLDCSNFTAWVYNYAFGIRFSSAVIEQADPELEPRAGRKLRPGEALKKGDLLFIWNKERTKIAHVALYIGERGGEEWLIDSTTNYVNGELVLNGVATRRFRGWYVERFSHARRVFE